MQHKGLGHTAFAGLIVDFRERLLVDLDQGPILPRIEITKNEALVVVLGTLGELLLGLEIFGQNLVNRHTPRGVDNSLGFFFRDGGAFFFDWIKALSEFAETCDGEGACLKTVDLCSVTKGDTMYLTMGPFIDDIALATATRYAHTKTGQSAVEIKRLSARWNRQTFNFRICDFFVARLHSPSFH